MFVRDWFRQWPKVAATLRPRSQETIDHTLLMAAPFGAKFESRRLDSLQPLECARWASRNRGRMRFVKTILGDAVLAGVLAENPMSGQKPPPASRGEYVPSHEEVLALGRAGAARGLSELIYVAAGTGMRLSELAALEGGDVADGPNDRTLLVSVREGKRAADGKPRPRTVVARGLAVRPLQKVRARDGLLLRTRGGGRWTRQAVSAAWVPTREFCALPAACTFHALRKHHATALLDAGVSDVDVAIQLGHFDRRGNPDPELVRRVYGRPDHAAALGRVAAA